MAQLQTEGGVMFGEPTVIARAGAGGSVIGICAGPGPGSVTCTLQPHGVQIFDVASSTCTQSWALRGRRPALPAAVAGSGGRLVLACEDRQVISWSCTDTDIQAAKVAKVDGDLYAVLTEPSMEAVALFFKDGKVRLLSTNLQQELGTAVLQLPKGSSFLHAEMTCSAQASGKGDSAFLLVAVSTAKKGGTLWRVRITGSTAGGWTVAKPRSEELAPPGADGASVVSCAAHPGSSVLSVVWSDGAWSRLRVTGANTANKSVVVGDSEVGGARLGGAGGVAEGTVATAMGADYLVLVGRQQAGGVAAGKRGPCNALVAMDSVYGTEQGRVELQWDAHDDGSSDFATHTVLHTAAALDGSFLAVALSSSVAAIPTSASPMTLDLALATAAHRRASASSKARADVPVPAALRPVDISACLAQVFVGQPKTPTKDKDGNMEGTEGAGAEGAGGVEVMAAGVDVIARAVKDGNRRELAVMAKLEALDKEGSAGGNAKIVKAVKDLIEELQAEAESDVRRLVPPTPLKTPTKGGAKEKPAGEKGGRRRCTAVVSAHLVAWVCARVVEEGRKGMLDGAALALVQAGCVSARAHEGMFAYTVEKGDLVLLEAMLKHVRDIPERDLVQALKLVLVDCKRSSMDAFVTHWAAAVPTQAVPDHDAVRRHLLDLILSSPKDHFLLTRALSRLTLKQTLRLLRYCQSLLKMHGVAPVLKLPKLRGARAPSLACVVEWTNALIDAHFSSLVLAKECHGLLKDLKKLTKAETDLARETVSMDGLLQHLIQRKPLPGNPVRPYTVDTLYL